MKKALVLLLALSMVFGAFADEPVANVNVSEFKGEASVTWGVDLDAKETGFKNDAKVTLKLNLIDGGDKSSTGEGVWGEIKIKTDGDTFAKAEGDDALALPGLKVKVDAAKLHFGENAYIGITSGDTQVGEYKLDTAVAAEQIMNENVGDADYKNGIVAGYGNDMFSVDVDFRSAKTKADKTTSEGLYVVAKWGPDTDGKYTYYLSDGTTIASENDYDIGDKVNIISKDAEDSQYSNAYSFAIDGSLKAVENLTLKGGYSADFANKWDETLETGFYVASDYKLGLNDTFYLKPQVGYTQSISSADKSSMDLTPYVPADEFEGLPEELKAAYKEMPTTDAKAIKGNIVAALLFGWGDKDDAKPGVYFLDSDEDGKNSKKVTPGISVAVSVPVLEKQSATIKMGEDDDDTIEGTITTKAPTTLAVSFFSGTIVENLTASAYFATSIGETQFIMDDGEDEMKTSAVKAEGYEFAAGLKYKLAVGEGSITPQFGIAMSNEGFNTKVINYTDKDTAADNKDKEVLNIKAGVEFGGYVENTTFSVVYASNNLKDKDNAGTLNFTCKIAL